MNFVDANLVFWATVQALSQGEIWHDRPKKWIFENLRYDKHNLTGGKDTL